MKKTTNNISAMVAVLAVAFLFSSCGGVGTPLPKDIIIQSPSAEVPAALAKFSGGWKGIFTIESDVGGSRPNTLIVKRISSINDIDVAYGWGAYTNHTRGNYSDGNSGNRPMKARFINDKSLSLNFENGNSATYTMDPSGETLHAVYCDMKRGVTSVAIMTRIDQKDLAGN